MNRVIHVVTTLVCAHWLGACGDGADSDAGDARDGGSGGTCVGLFAAPLFGGGSSGEFLQLTEQQEGAIVRISVGDEEAPGICSGVLVRPGWVLTAAHCGADTAQRLAVHLDTDSDGRGHVVEAREVEPHPTLDALLLGLGDVPELATRMPPPAITEDRLGDLLGSRVVLSGFGLDENYDSGHRQFLVEPLVDIGPAHLAVESPRDVGACVGDSGGALLGRADDGHVALLGILRGGSASCTGRDEYLRADLLDPWVTEVTGVAASSEGSDAGCGDITAEGRCFDGLSVRCDGDVLHAQRCQPDACGWDESLGGYGCVEPDEDPCGGVGALGACEGSDVIVCQQGALRAHACDACDECVIDPATQRAGCRPRRFEP